MSSHRRCPPLEHREEPQTLDSGDSHLREEVESLTAALQAANTRLDELVTLDALTGALNRPGLAQVLAHISNRAQREESLPVTVLVACENVSLINQRFGDALGDETLVEVCRRIRSTLRVSDYIARVGGGEFLAILPEAGYWEAIQIAERMRRKVAHPLPFGGPDALQVAVSVGVCRLPALLMTAEEVVTLTRAELLKARESATLATEDSLTPAGQHATTLLDRLSSDKTYRAVREPIMRLTDERICGYELLTRTTIPGLEAPDDFFGAALEHNVLTLTDLCCMKAALAGAKAVGDPALVYHINIFPTTLLNTPSESVVDLLRSIHPLQVCLEVTEQQFFGDNQRLLSKLEALKQAGHQIALDDVGFGRTSLELLILLAPDIVKIDRRFVHGVAQQAAQRRAFRRLVEVIRSVGATIIAEGLENADDKRTIRNLGVQYAQGRHWRGEHKHISDCADVSADAGHLRNLPSLSYGPHVSASRTSEEITSGKPRATRHVMSVPALYRLGEGHPWQRGRTRNLSDTGLLFETMCQMPVEALTELTLYLPETFGRLPGGQLTCLGEVVRQVPPTEGFPHAAAVRWLTTASDGGQAPAAQPALH